ncbi:glycosyltransferase [Curvibacter gracilis]|uniref:glycosyltransferase n=1 Tax=Curvibacter gracilis TaxID=230310 RepID=UPI0004B757F3|nr:glycosyltransferase [Curvibacter gracilis]
MPTQETVSPRPEKHPYYIATSDYDGNAVHVHQMHLLCHELNSRGAEAYVFGARHLNGHWWTPILSLEQRAAHYKAGKKPVWIHLSTSGTWREQSHWTLAYTPESLTSHMPTFAKGRITFASGTNPATLTLPLALPWIEEGLYHPDPEARRGEALVYADRYLKLGGKLPTRHETLVNLAQHLNTPQERAQALRQASLIYCYEPGAITTEALLSGCPVVYVQNDRTLIVPPTSSWQKWGTAWGEDPETLIRAQGEMASFQEAYRNNLQNAGAELSEFIEQTQQALQKQPFDAAWSNESVSLLGELVIDTKDMAQHADQSKYQRIQQQFKTWRKRTTLREIDGEIYAEHVASGALPAFAVCVFVRNGDLDGLAQTLDSLEQNFYQAAELHVLADFECPIPLSELGPNCVWHSGVDASEAFAVPLPEWLLLVESGAQLAPQALVEFALAARNPTTALLYSDESLIAKDGTETPHFKPQLNTEWLHSTNYLGAVVAIRAEHWLNSPAPKTFESVYALALHLSEKPRAIQHIDTVLFSSDGHVSASRELIELQQLEQHLTQRGLHATVTAQAIAGCRLLQYRSETPRGVSMIIPTGYQLGYLRCLLQSLKTYQEDELLEVILVTQADHEVATRNATADIGLPVPLHLITTPAGPYNHGLALNAGAATAKGDVLLFADDDTEAIQRHWLSQLTAYYDQPDVACVAPRLVLQIGDKPTLQSGPMSLGITDWAGSYNGERRLLEEQGVFSRLQTSQDVATVAGHFFLLRRDCWQQLGGFDTESRHTFTTVHDFCIRASQQGQRHVWTPVSSVLHQGGKTLEALAREPGRMYEIQASALKEKQSFMQRWIQFIASDGRYNRHLSLQTPYDVEANLVIDWMSTRKDRPTVLAFPISSGSGQYRVVEPLNALQHAGLAQTCNVFPISSSQFRTPNPLEVTRANPDRIIVQHSIGDAHLQLLRDYRRTNPALFTIQTVDDLFHDLPEKHHLHNIHQREGYVRMREAMSLCDRVIVSTQPLLEEYRGYCKDIRVMPNCLDDQVWGQFYKVPAPRSRLRVGWAGAAQHLGDLEMIGEVVARFKDEVDWIFMGMCPDSLRPHIKEFHPFVSYVDYPAKLASLDLDIAIAPLEDNPFNRCKSNLRLLEYGAMGWPVVCSDVYPFRTENPPVLRVPNEKEAWIESLRRLIDDSALRHQMGRQLNQWVSDNFYLSKNTDKWFSAIFD